MDSKLISDYDPVTITSGDIFKRYTKMQNKQIAPDCDQYLAFSFQRKNV